jgi:probable selenium-dependent hydroxylase accessory protein YqeC
MTGIETRLPNSWQNGSLWSMTGRVQVVTFIGAGGKTTCLRSLTQEIDSAGQRVIATTTTKVFPEERMNSWKNPDPPPYEQEGACFWYVDILGESGKWIGPPLKAVDEAIGRAKAVLDVGSHVLPLHASANAIESERISKITNDGIGASPGTVSDVSWVIEGDGARGLRLKCWEPHEPQIPRSSDCGVLVLDGGLWGKVLQAEQVHRPGACQDLLGHVWNAETAWRYFLRSPVFAPQYGQMSWVILLNSKESMDSPKPLLELNYRWTESRREVNDREYRPKHLRLAAGDAKEGRLQWFDLW